VAAWLMHRPPKLPAVNPALEGVAVLTLSTGANQGDHQRAREFIWCLPGELVHDHVPIVPPERLITLQAQTHRAIHRGSARALGLAVGARWVVYGNIADGTANVFVAEVLNDRTVHADSFRLDDVKARCTSFAAATAERIAAEPLRR